jgi:hypothetical protein
VTLHSVAKARIASMANHGVDEYLETIFFLAVPIGE